MTQILWIGVCVVAVGLPGPVNTTEMTPVEPQKPSI